MFVGEMWTKKNLFLIGVDTSDLIEISPQLFLLPQTYQAFQNLQARARQQGFELKIISAHRTYEKQKQIWQAKTQGKKELLALDGTLLDYRKLTGDQVVEAILRWSAIPGASRHHWGTEIDIIDQAALERMQKNDPSFKVRLTPQEVSAEGIFGPMHSWLNEVLASEESFGFFRPYENDRGGVAPEMWHLSYRPLSEDFLNQYSFDLFSQMIEQSDLHFKDYLQKNCAQLYQRYILNISP